jgi:ubiquinone/menaquinone biosynthesis C-methylase UbiE
MMTWLLVIVVLAGAGVFVWWLLIETEGVYLGQRIVVWLYDVYAKRYDRIKQFDPDYERWLLAKPLLEFIAPLNNPLVLDVATGTGRLPIALLEHEYFHGNIIGVDLSRRMLAEAAEKLAPYDGRVSLLWAPAQALPFPDNTFDVVTCLESLEFMNNRKDVLRELVRVLRPGGLLLVTNRINARWMPGRTMSDVRMFDLLGDAGIAEMDSQPWQLDYHKMWGFKAGESVPTGAIPLAEVLQCPRCPDHPMIERNGEWFCTHCTAWTRTGDDGVIELLPLYTQRD